MAITHNLNIPYFYPNIPSALKPVEHDDSLPFHNPPQQRTLREEKPPSTFPDDKYGPSRPNVDPDFPEQTVSHLILQSELNDLVTDFNLSKIQRNFCFSSKGMEFVTAKY
jgi:hypothetical protein